MSVGNKQVVRRWFEEVWNQQKTESIARMMTPDAVVHGLGAGSMTGPAAFAAFQQAYVSAMPDFRIVVEDLIEEDDRVVARWRATGTLTGPGLGLTPTGKQINLLGVTIARIHDGQIAEGWNAFDTLAMHQQLGTLPEVAAQGDEAAPRKTRR